MNIVIADGRLTKDPEFKVVSTGTPLLTFTLASDIGYKEHKATNFLSCELWGKKAEAMQNYLVKGKPITIQAEMKTNEWTDDQGTKKTMMKFRVLDVTFHMKDSTGDEPRKQTAPEAQRSSYSNEHAAVEDVFGDDSDIPF